MINETGGRDGVSQACRLKYLSTLDEELQVAVDVIGQLKVIQQLVLFNLDELAGLVGMLKLLGTVAQLEIVDVVEYRAVLRGIETVLGHRNRALDDCFLRILPLVLIVAHEE